MSLAPGSRLGSYEVTAPLGEGGMGVVYRATDPKLKRDVAIKVLPEEFARDPERLARFEREAQLLAQLSHPNVASVFGLEESNGVRALVMELVEGPTLSERLAGGPLGLEEALGIARQIAEALEEAHEKGIVHRDLKPANVKVTADGKVKVLDFGLAKAMDPGGRGASATELARSPTLMNSPTLTAVAGTQLGVILGTAAYMSPEQAKGKPADKRADVWSFGVVLFEMLAGRRLFEGETASETLAAVIRQEVDWGALPAGTPPSIRGLLARCLERDPRRRLRDVGEARIALDGAPTGGIEPRTPDAPSAKRPARREALAWGLVALLAVASSLAWLAGRSRPATEPTPRVIRSVLPLPPGVSIELDGERAGMPALSPDGRRVAFGAREGAGPMWIWVQELATGEARALAGTQGGSRPFWSPDSRRIGFFTWGHLSTVPADGGAVARLAAARDARGGTWSPDGTIVFSPNASGPLFAVSERGGEARPVTGTVEEVGWGSHRFPQFLPDGKSFVYLLRPGRFGSGGSPRVVVGRLGSPAPAASLLDQATNALFSDGHLLYVRDGALQARALDPRKLELGDAAPTLVGDLLVNRRFSYGVFSASPGGLLAFLTGRQRDQAQLVWRDRSGRRLGELGTPGNLSGYGGLALSVDGRRAAVSRVDEETSEADIWLYDLVRGTETRISRPHSDESDPVFAPDGSALFFRTSVKESSTIVRRELASGAEAVLLESRRRRDVAPTSVSPDGAWISCDERDPTFTGDVLLVPTSGLGGTPPALAAGKADEGFAQVSPDGRWIAWASDESGRYEVFVARFPEADARVRVSREGGSQPRWNPRGGELLFKDPDNVLTAVPVDTASGTFSVGSPTRLFPIVEFFGWTYAVAPDGERFLTREPLAEKDASPVTLLTGWTSLLSRR